MVEPHPNALLTERLLLRPFMPEDVGFDRAGLQRIVAFAVPANIASRKVMEHLGMRLEGEAQLFGLDLVRYAVGPDEFSRAMATVRLRNRRQEASPRSIPPGGQRPRRRLHRGGSGCLPLSGRSDCRPE